MNDAHPFDLRRRAYPRHRFRRRGGPQHMVDAVTEGRASAALIASIVHYGEYTIGQLKQYMADRGMPVRLTW